LQAGEPGPLLAVRACREYYRSGGFKVLLK
jgi:hypothetical protein